MTKPRIGQLYTFRPNGWDRFHPHAGTPAEGTIVRAIKSPHGCPKFGTMGHCYVATPEGKFLGLVSLGSLAPLGDFAIVDEEAVGGPKVVHRTASENEASEWIGNQPDKAKIERGGYGIDGPETPSEDATVAAYVAEGLGES